MTSRLPRGRGGESLRGSFARVYTSGCDAEIHGYGTAPTGFDPRVPQQCAPLVSKLRGSKPVGRSPWLKSGTVRVVQTLQGRWSLVDAEIHGHGMARTGSNRGFPSTAFDPRFRNPTLRVEIRCFSSVLVRFHKHINSHDGNEVGSKTNFQISRHAPSH